MPRTLLAPRHLLAGVAVTVAVLASPLSTAAAIEAKPVGWKPLASAAAAKLVKRTGWEPRPQNTPSNQRIPGRAALEAWRARSEMPYASLVDGDFAGTTDEIIQWAARKWGFR